MELPVMISAQYKRIYTSMCVLWLIHTLLPVLTSTAFAAQDLTQCHLTSHFSCYNDCCLKEEMFCHEREQRCVLCENKKELCGTEKEPRDCMLYCYKLKQENNPTESESQMCFPEVTVYLFFGVAGVEFLLLVLLVAALLFCRYSRWYSRYKAQDKVGSSVELACVEDDHDATLKGVETECQDTEAKPLLCEDQLASKQPSRSSLPSDATGSNDTIGSSDQKSMQLTKREGTENDHDVNNDNPSPSMTSRSSSPTTTIPLGAVPPERARPAAPPEQPIQDPGNGVLAAEGVGLEVNSVHETPAVQGFAGGEGYSATAKPTAQGRNPNFSSIPASADPDPNGTRSIHTGTESGVFHGTVAV